MRVCTAHHTTSTTETQTPVLSSVSEVQTDVSGDTLRALVRDEAQRLAEEARVATAETARADAAAVTDAHHRQISALQGRLRQQQRDLDLALAREGDLRRQIASLQADNVQVAALAQSMAAGSVGERDDGAGVGGASRGGGGDAAGAGTGEQAAAVLRTMKERYEESVRQLRAVFTVRVQGLVLCPRLRVDQARSSLTWPPRACPLQSKEESMKQRIERLTAEVRKQEQEFVSTVNSLTQQVVRTLPPQPRSCHTRSRPLLATPHRCLAIAAGWH